MRLTPASVECLILHAAMENDYLKANRLLRDFYPGELAELWLAADKLKSAIEAEQERRENE